MQNVNKDRKVISIRSRSKAREKTKFSQTVSAPRSGSLRDRQSYQNTQQANTYLTDDLAEKEPSKIGIVLLVAIVTILYSGGIYQLNNSVTNIVETVVEKVERDYELKGF